MAPDYRDDRDTTGLRVLFCMGITQRFFDAEEAQRRQFVDAFVAAFGGLEQRLGVRVLGTLDDDDLMVGPSTGWPWTAYILAQAPDLDAVQRVCNLVRETAVGPHRLWRFMRIEARVGNPLFGGVDPTG